MQGHFGSRPRSFMVNADQLQNTWSPSGMLARVGEKATCLQKRTITWETNLNVKFC